MFAMSHSLNLDSNCPPWTPRDASPAEAAEVQKIRDMQRKITEYMGSRSMSSRTWVPFLQLIIRKHGVRSCNVTRLLSTRWIRVLVQVADKSVEICRQSWHC